MMTESDARNVYLIRAVERADPQGKVLSSEMQMEAAKAAGGNELLEEGALEKDEDAPLEKKEADFLGRWANDLEQRLRRKSAIPKGLGSKSIPGWIGPSLVGVALLIGFLSANLGSEGAQLNILALPLLGILGWNLTVYALALFGLITGASSRRSGILTSLARKVGQLGKVRGAEDEEEPFGRKDQVRFAVEWFEESLPVHSSRLGVMLHYAAAALAVGGVAGLFYQGWSVQYVAVWESTLFDAESLAGFFHFLFSPASWVTGVEIPLETLPEIQRGAGMEPVGGNALPWLQLYAGMMGLYVVVPRVIFGIVYQVHTRQLRANFPISAAMRPQLSKVLRGLKGESLVAEVIPYAFSPEPKVRDSVRGLLHDLWGGAIYPEFRTPVDYGDEEEFLEDPLPEEPKYTVLLMNFSATPEDEAHGFLGRALRDRIVNGGGRAGANSEGGALLVLLDGSAFSERLGELPEFPRRAEEREAAWSRVMERVGLQVVALNVKGAAKVNVADVATKVWVEGSSGKVGETRND